MRKKLKIKHSFFAVAFLVGIWGSVHAQILDDSTKLVYGPYTTYFNTYEDFKFNKYEYRKLDTLFVNFHDWEFVKNMDYKIQDLGNNGTAAKELFYKPIDNLGARSGFDLYKPYHFKPQDVKYYDTKSPYTSLRADFGSGRRNRTTVEHAQNITPYWNAGVMFRRIRSEKQISSKGRGDDQVKSTAYYFHSHYQSPNGKFSTLGHISRFYTEVQENGGVSVADDARIADYFDEDARTKLYEAKSRDLNISTLLFSEYKLRDELQFYGEWQTGLNKNMFIDNNLAYSLSSLSGGKEGDFFRKILINKDSTTNRYQFNTNLVELGVKGDKVGLFYSFYTKFRNYKFIHPYLPYNEKGVENYIGYYIRFKNKKGYYIDANGEYLIRQGYKLGGSIESPILKVKAISTSYQPTIIQNTSFQNHGEWYNNFSPVYANQIEGRIILPLDGIKVGFKGTVTNVTDNIYFDTNAQPAQAKGNAQLLYLGVDFNLKVMKNWHIDGEGIYTALGGDNNVKNSFRIPEFFATTKVYYSKNIKNIVFYNFGIETHYKSDYYADDYDPSIQQFYIQNSFKVPAYLLMDAFLNFQIDHFSMFLKLQHINQATGEGYFTFPRYPGVKRGLDIGIRWMFFD